MSEHGLQQHKLPLNSISRDDEVGGMQKDLENNCKN